MEILFDILLVVKWIVIILAGLFIGWKMGKILCD